MYQAVSAQAAAIHKMFVSTLGVSSASCAVTEEPSSGHSTCPVVVIPDFADTTASIKKVLTACPKPGETQHPCAALVQSRHLLNLTDG
jgi:hypothetical protein